MRLTLADAGMSSLSLDTHPDAERVWIELIRKASLERRFQLVRSLSATAIDLARRAIAEANPGFTADELSVAFVRVHHGDDLAGCLDRFLARRRRGGPA